MTKNPRLINLRYAPRYISVQPDLGEVIFDFGDDWHFAMRFKEGMSKTQVAQELHRCAAHVLNRDEKDQTND